MWLAPNTTYSNLQKWDNLKNFQYLETPEELSTYVHDDSKIWILPEKLNTIFYSPDSYIHLNVMALLRLCKNIALKIDP